MNRAGLLLYLTVDYRHKWHANDLVQETIQMIGKEGREPSRDGKVIMQHNYL